jgi:ribosome assembly protein 1
VFLEEVTVTPSTDDETSARDKIGRLTGEVIKTAQQAIRQGFLDWSPRLLLAMYSCEIQASSKPHLFPPFILPALTTRQPKS